MFDEKILLNNNVLKNFWREFKTRYQWHYGFAVFSFIALVLIEDQISHANLTPLQIVLLQFMSVFSLVLSLTITHALLHTAYPLWMKKRFWLSHIITIFLAHPITILFDYVFDSIGLSAGLFSQSSHTQLRSFLTLFLEEYIKDLKYTVFFWVTTEILYNQIIKTQSAIALASTSAETQFNIYGFLNKIPIEYHSKIDVIEAQQNYIKVYTQDKEFLLLYRFGKAIEELGEKPGIKVHRSFWVNYTAMNHLKTLKGNLFILTKSGQKIPVSRSFREQVKKLNLPHSN